jgi:hypothetical protein
MKTFTHNVKRRTAMKRSNILSGCTLVAAALSYLILVQQAAAFEMTTEITNLSGAAVVVDLYAKGATGSAALYSTLSISNATKKSTTFLSLTGLCPSYLTGKVGDAPIAQMTCGGAESSSTSERCCANLQFTVYKKPDGSYHFVKMQQIN